MQSSEEKNISRIKSLTHFFETKRRMPSYTEMAKLFGVSSKNAVSKIVEKFIDAGLVTKDALGRLIPDGIANNDVPLLGSVTAGFPASVEGEIKETYDTISLEHLLLSKRGATYFLEVDGDSMIEAHIADGDLVLVEKTEHAKDGDIVIACIDDEWTMKYLRSKNNTSWLEPANKKYKPLYPERSLEVAAVVRAVIRKY